MFLQSWYIVKKTKQKQKPVDFGVQTKYTLITSTGIKSMCSSQMLLVNSTWLTDHQEV